MGVGALSGGGPASVFVKDASFTFIKLRARRPRLGRAPANQRRPSCQLPITSFYGSPSRVNMLWSPKAAKGALFSLPASLPRRAIDQ